MSKTYADTYLYREYPEYEKKLFGFILNAERIDTKSKEFEDILIDIKRSKISNALAKVATSDNVILGLMPDSQLPKSFKVFAAKDVKLDKSKTKVFIDVSGFIQFKDGQYVCKNMEWLTSYLINAMTSLIYAIKPTLFESNGSIVLNGSMAFTKLFTYIIDRMYKISSVTQLKNRVSFLACMYYQINILSKAYNDTTIASCIKASGCTENDARWAMTIIKNDAFSNIDTFVKALTKLGFNDLKTSAVVSMWMKSFGTGTTMALEFFPTLSAMLTDTYVGGYLNQQLSIEKIVDRTVIDFTKQILTIGAGVV